MGTDVSVEDGHRLFQSTEPTYQTTRFHNPHQDMTTLLLLLLLLVVVVFVVRVMKSRIMRRAGYVARMEGRGEAYTGFWWGNLRERDH